jgi:hypothetical protein
VVDPVADTPRPVCASATGGVEVSGYRVYLAQDDQDRLERLQTAWGFTGVVSLFRVVVERCMVRYPDESHITKSFLQKCERASADLVEDSFSKGKGVFLVLGDRYSDYLHAMAGPLRFEKMSRMLRALLLMVERGEV